MLHLIEYGFRQSYRTQIYVQNRRFSANWIVVFPSRKTANCASQPEVERIEPTDRHSISEYEETADWQEMHVDLRSAPRG
jgi:hypothetical protein